MKTIPKLAVSIAALLAIVGSVTGQEVSAPGHIKVGAISVLSGEGASWGVNHQRGTLLAAEEFNRKGGINGRSLEVIFEDSPSGIARNAVSAYTKLTSNDHVKFILGPLMMDEMLALAPLSKRDGVFLGGATYMPNPGDNAFSTWIDADLESDRIAREVLSKYKKVAILASQQSWEEQVAVRFNSTFTHFGGSIVLFEKPSFDAADVRAEVLKMKQKRPEAVFITSYLLLAKYLKEMRALGMSLPIFSLELDQSVIDSCSGAAEGLIFIAPDAPTDAFVKKFRERWKAEPDIPAASSYDAANLLFTAMNESGAEVKKVIDFFKAFQGYDGAVGRIERVDGKTVISTALYRVEHGKIVRKAAAAP
ncbi:MAG: ABC transporter substrate-binding protein [Oligoflexia bacterium]|nr:ABC transporter substrate-binding protein [Oligoflexia bacterium]